MNPLKQFLKLHRLELEARACVDRSSAQKLIRKAEKAKRKLEDSRCYRGQAFRQKKPAAMGRRRIKVYKAIQERAGAGERSRAKRNSRHD